MFKKWDKQSVYFGVKTQTLVFRVYILVMCIWKVIHIQTGWSRVLIFICEDWFDLQDNPSKPSGTYMRL